MAIGLPVGSTCEDGLRCVNNGCIAPTTCQANSDCEAPTPLCVVAAGGCGECDSAAECGDRVCGDDHLCRDCAADTECETGFCSPATHTCKGATITPKYLPSACDAPANNDLTFLVDTNLDTSMDAICTGGIVMQTNGPDICVFRHGKISVPSGVTLTITGTRAVAFVADTQLEIAGTVDLGANGDVSGPGGGATSSGGYTSAVKGEGGAGFQTAGGHGGELADGSGANGGPPLDAIASPTFAGGPNAGTRTGHGAGGGAAMFVACSGSITVSGLLDAGGSGGAGGYFDPNDGANGTYYGGRGGGAGGQLLFQARSITVSGTVVANGGGGGAGKPNTNTTAVGNAGVAGKRDTTCARGGFGGANGGAGGPGGCLGQSPGNGGAFVPTNNMLLSTAGGGGGSVGFLRTAMPAGISPTITAAIVSPAFSANETIETH